MDRAGRPSPEAQMSTIFGTLLTLYIALCLAYDGNEWPWKR